MMFWDFEVMRYLGSFVCALHGRVFFVNFLQAGKTRQGKEGVVSFSGAIVSG